MFNQNKDLIYLPKNRFIWFLLAFSAAFVNVGGFFAVHQFVSHVTGLLGYFGVYAGQGQWTQAMMALLVPLSFLCGAIFSGLFTDARRQVNKAPIYFHLPLINSFLYLFIAIAGTRGVLGVFGEPFENINDFFIAIVLSFSCGIQNALFTSFSGAIIRTTHMTGLMTDLGLNISQIFSGRASNDIKKNVSLKIELIISFCLGGLCGSYAFLHFDYLGFLIPTLICMLISLRLFFLRLKIK